MAHTARLVERYPTGGAVWSLPDCELEVLWGGPGEPLLLGRPRVPGGAVRRIEHPVARNAYQTMTEANAALCAFVSAVLSDI